MKPPLRLVVNGEAREYADGASPANLAELIASLGLDPEMLVAEVNGNIVKRRDVRDCVLSNGDTIELVRFVGGG